MAGVGFNSNASFRAQMCTVMCVGRNVYCSVQCHWSKTPTRFVAFRGQLKSGAAVSVACRRKILPRSWHSAVNLRQWLAFRDTFESGMPQVYNACAVCCIFADNLSTVCGK
jgi:hypothetical protein